VSSSYQPHPQLLGLIELDQAGTVLYARLEKDDVRRDLSGLNFFSEVAPFSNVEEFRRRIDEFTSGCEQANRFNFTCNFDDGEVRVRVLVARMGQRTGGERAKSILVHIRRSNENDLRRAGALQ
jgi:hypothetical protein